MGIIFDDFSFLLFLFSFVFYTYVKSDNWEKSEEYINPFIFSFLLEFIMFISSGIVGKLLKEIFFRAYKGVLGNNLISIFNLIINATMVLVIIIFAKINSTSINDLQRKIRQLKLENQIFGMLLSLFVSFELILFIGDFEEITVFIRGTILVIFVSFLFFMTWQMINLIHVFSMRQKIDNEREQNKQLSEYLESIQEQYDDLRKFKHDFKNIILSMSQNNNVDRRGDYEALSKELSQQREFNYDLEGKIISEYKLIHNEALKGLVIQKFLNAKSQNITLNIEIDEIVNITENVIDIVRIIGVVLDNAIEETQKCKNKNISMAFIKNDNTLEISVENPLNHEVDVRKIFKDGYSTKGIGRGAGLANVRKIVDSKSNLYLDTEIINDNFRITLMILERG